MKPNVFLISFLLLVPLFIYTQTNSKSLLFIGSYTAGKADTGIYVYEFNNQSGEPIPTLIIN